MNEYDWRTGHIDQITANDAELANIRAHPYLSIPKFLRNLDVKTVPKPLIEMDQLHIDLHKFIEEHDKSVVVIGRGFAKTQHASIGLSCAEIGKNTDIRIKLGSESLSLSTERVVSVRDHIEFNVDYQKLFPNVKKSRGSWGSEAFSVDRTEGIPDPTMMAFGAQTGITGGRVDLFIFDDFCGERVARERAARETAKKVFWNSLNLLADGGKLVYIGTPFDPDDLTMNLMSGAPQNGFHLFFRPVKEVEVTKENPWGIESPWERKWTPEKLKKKRDEFYFNGQAGEWFKGYLCSPITETESIFNKKDIDDSVVIIRDGIDPFKYFEIDKTWDCIMTVDPAFTKKTRSDYAVIVVGYVNKVTKIRIPVIIFRKKTNPTDLALAIIDHAKRWEPKKILIENVQGSGDTLTHLVESEMKSERKIFDGKLPIETVFPISDKIQRQSRLSSTISAKYMKIPTHQHPMMAGSSPCNCGHCSLIKEMYQSPNSTKDDCMDGVELLDREAAEMCKSHGLVIDWM